MFEIFKNDKSTLKKIIRNTASKNNLEPPYIEKDLWVSAMLYYLFNISKFKELFTFTGGTCLSKCYHCINRFSEDIDIGINISVVGSEEEIIKAQTISKRDKIIKKIKADTKTFLIKKFIPIMNNDLSSIFGNKWHIKITYENDCVCLYYPVAFKDLYIDPRVKIEIGTLGTMKPNSNQLVNSIIAKTYKNKMMINDFNVKAISIERIFWDKVTILHQEAHRSADKILPERCARHYYDLYCLGHYKDVKEKAIKNHKLLKNVVDSKFYFYYRSWAKYEECLVKKIKLLPPKYNIEKLKKDYLKMSGMFLKQPPKFEQILNYLTKLEKELNE